MKTKNILTLIVAVGLTSFVNRASAAIIELNLNDQRNYIHHSVSATERRIELRFRFIDDFSMSTSSVPGYSQDAISIKSEYYDNSWDNNISINSLSEVEAWGTVYGLTSAFAVSAGQSIYYPTGESTNVLGYNYIVGYYPDEVPTTATTINSYGLSVSASPQYVGLFSYGHFGYVEVSIPNADGKMYINKVAFNDVYGQGIIAGGGAIPEPSTYGLIGIAALGVAFAARRRKQKAV
jgi:hypothetical protein